MLGSDDAITLTIVLSELNSGSLSDLGRTVVANRSRSVLPRKLNNFDILFRAMRILLLVSFVTGKFRVTIGLFSVYLMVLPNIIGASGG